MTAEITKLNIIRFGKLKDLELEVKDGLNVIYGANESGKSTINLFIKAMLYGLAVKKPSGDNKKERERALPWDEKNAEGILTVKADGRIIEIRRKFGVKAQSDKLLVCDGVTGEKIEFEGSVGEWLFGISPTVFEKTVWVRQSCAYMGGAEEELLKKIINLSDGGDENVSAAEAIKRLNEIRKGIKAKNRASNDGRIDILEKRLDECKREKYELATTLSQKEATRVRKAQAEEELLKTEERIAILDKAYKESLDYEKSLADIGAYRKFCEYNAKAEEIENSDDFKKGSKLTDKVVGQVQQTQAKIEALEKELTVVDEPADGEDGKMPILSVVAGAVLGILGIIGIVLSVTGFSKMPVAILSGVICVASAIVLAQGVKRIEKYFKTRLEKEKQRNQAKIEALSIKAEADALKNELERCLSDFDVADVHGLERLYITIQGLVEKQRSIIALRDELAGQYDMEELKEKADAFTDREVESSVNLDTALREARQLQMELKAEIKGLESKMAYQVGESRISADIDTEMNSIKEEITALERRLLVIDTAIEHITAVAEEWKSTVTPKLNNAVNEIMSYLTAGKYDDIRVSDVFSMKLIADKNLYEAEYLSKGTYEQLYLALRIALAKNENDECPMFFDDILTVYDDERAAAALKYLIQVNKGSSFIFTCHRHIRDMGISLGANVINL